LFTSCGKLAGVGVEVERACQIPVGGLPPMKPLELLLQLCDRLHVCLLSVGNEPTTTTTTTTHLGCFMNMHLPQPLLTTSFSLICPPPSFFPHTT